ncbi:MULTISPECIES: hypothetical protein [Streptomyces]|uniref:Uncharacterized protein n=1 Tax=Streptomyces venezuelae TaxID=54571 RepID=A0A5P2ARF8_STRVZ|nr:hypothetical protein [Streptomyces venezuelae]QES20705.1 hypothetical protein DEJ46_17560 [Streptomyces venezuelae]
MSGIFDSPGPRRVLPGEYPLLEEALALVNRDLAATLPDVEPLRLLALPSWDEGRAEDVYVAMANGEWQGNCLEPSSADSPAHALAAVADAAQETVSELLWQAWPVCGEHAIGMHLREEDGHVGWWCAGRRSPHEPAHVRAAIGALDTLARPHRPNRKRRRHER